MSFLKQAKDQYGAAQVVGGQGKQKWLSRIRSIRTRQATGDWMLLKLLVSKEVNVTPGSEVSS